MKELVGYCKTCEKPVYCNDGFLDGVVTEDKTVLCFECLVEDREDSEKKE